MFSCASIGSSSIGALSSWWPFTYSYDVLILASRAVRNIFLVISNSDSIVSFGNECSYFLCSDILLMSSWLSDMHHNLALSLPMNPRINDMKTVTVNIPAPSNRSELPRPLQGPAPSAITSPLDVASTQPKLML